MRSLPRVRLLLRLARLRLLYAVLAETNEAIFRATTLDGLLEAAGRALQTYTNGQNS